MLWALKSFRIPSNFLKRIEQFYTMPTFQVDSWFGESAKGDARGGIRQGFPLSPEFFSL